MKKNFILDTNVLLHDPNAIFSFADNNVCIPIYVIEEIDQFKKDLSELGQNARQVSRLLDGFRKRGNIRKGVQINGGGCVRVLFAEKSHAIEIASTNIPDISISHAMDRLIMGVALDLMNKEPDIPAIFVTKDTNLRIRADALGLKSVDYDRERKDVTELYSGWTDLLVPGEMIDQLKEQKTVPLPEGLFYENEYLLLKNRLNSSHTALGRVRLAEKLIESIIEIKSPIWGIKPRNKEQTFSLDALLRDDIKLVTLIGKAGTGKTLLALASGLEKVVEEKFYSRLLVSRPIFPLGKDLGYIPGDIEEKLNPWMQPIHDNIEFLMGISKAEKKGVRGYDELIRMGLIEVEPLTYIRGRSIPNQYMIVDEAQNLTPHEVKTILTRVGHGTKIVLTGDPYQIDNPYVDSVNNGLAYLLEKFKNERIAATVTLIKGERSELAERASNIL